MPLTVTLVMFVRQAGSSGLFVTVNVLLTEALFCGTSTGGGMSSAACAVCCGTNVSPMIEVTDDAV